MPRLDSMACAALSTLALLVGFGDIAEVNPPARLLLESVRSLLLVVIGLALVAALRARRWPRVPSDVALPTAAWLAVAVLSASLAESHRSDALSSLERPVGGALLAWAVCDVCRTRRNWLRVLRAASVGGLVVAAIALGEASGASPIQEWLATVRDGPVPIGDVPRVAATLSHPNEAAMLLELVLPLMIAGAWSARPRSRPWLAACAAGVLLALVLTFSRAGIFAALAALGVMASAAALRREPGRLRVPAMVMLVVPVALGWAALVDPGLDRRLLAGLDESGALQPSRPEFWSVAVDMVRDHPWLGVGPDNFRWLFASYSGVGADNLGVHAHDQYLETLADTGALGLLSLVWLLAALVLRALHAVRAAGADWPWRAALMASLSAWLIHAALDDFERFWPTSVGFWLIAGLSLAVEEPVDAANDGDHHQQHHNTRGAG
jgi:O-antigen ligase